MGNSPFNTQEIQVNQDENLRKRGFEAGQEKKNRGVKNLVSKTSDA